MSYYNFIGTGHNPTGPDLPLGFGMRLAQEPSAMNAYGRLSNEEKAAIIQKIQSGATGDEAATLINDAIESLRNIG